MQVKEYINKNTARTMIFFGVLSIYFGYSHDSSNFIPAEIKYGFGICALLFGTIAYYQHSRDESQSK